ncbi:CRISPR-associated protein Cas4 [Clostridium kluyveri]|uniref:CRISPR-associated protein Cas4 n=1 Tax=Clostridium kluyveri TaxID=1534 RepID=UPI0009FB8A6A|nr:CRISPR-associated protein Cas4 [Clostridium kluyveri]UZQ51389.1 CRISPR-associated protein Cas4 [Clostridium kluyveri]
MDINGVFLWYYNICKRELWLMSRKIVPDQQDENVDIGRFIHQNTYKRNKKEISFGNIKFDVIFRSKDNMVIGETKKSSKYKEASKWQLMFYLKTLKDAGIHASGQLLYPEERKREEVILDDTSSKELAEMISHIEYICSLDKPPGVKKIPYCKNCAYREYCFA